MFFSQLNIFWSINLNMLFEETKILSISLHLMIWLHRKAIEINKHWYKINYKEENLSLNKAFLQIKSILQISITEWSQLLFEFAKETLSLLMVSAVDKHFNEMVMAQLPWNNNFMMAIKVSTVQYFIMLKLFILINGFY